MATKHAIEKMAARYAPAVIGADLSQLSAGNRLALAKIVEASRYLTTAYQRQASENLPALHDELVTRAGTGDAHAQAVLRYFKQNGGPWSALDHDEPFIDGIAKRPPHANFYPQDITVAEFEAWLKTLNDEQKEEATGYFHVIRRGADGKLKTVPFSEEYAAQLQPAAQLLMEAATLTDNETLRNFLSLRAAALLNNDYVDSDIAWLNLDSPIELTFGPYETYMDDFQGHKAAFEAYVAVRDDAQTALLAEFSRWMQTIEDNLPLAKRYRNAKIPGASPIRVVNLLFGAGYANHGVQTAAFNLPNDEKVVSKHGTKQVMLRNVQEAKFNNVLVPIAKRLIHPSQQHLISFDAFFTFILMHELCHGLGPHAITVKGRATTVRQMLKELHSALEEAKADVCGLLALQLLIDKGFIPAHLADEMYVTFVAGIFRSIRFGINEAHGKSNIVQFNWLRDARAVTYDTATGTFKVNVDRVRQALRELAHEILTLQAKGSYKAGTALLKRYMRMRPRTQQALESLDGVPVDIEPLYQTAEELLSA